MKVLQLLGLRTAPGAVQTPATRAVSIALTVTIVIAVVLVLTSGLPAWTQVALIAGASVTLGLLGATALHLVDRPRRNTAAR